MAYANTARHLYHTSAVTSTATSGSTGLTAAGASFDDVIAFVNLTTQTAGTIAFQIQISMDDGTTWFSHPDSGAAIAAQSATGQYLAMARTPIGSKIRLLYTIVTGPSAFTLVWDFSKRGHINRR